LAGTRHRLSGFSQPRQCGDDGLRIFVTGGTPVRGGGMAHLIMANALLASVLRTTA